MGRTGRTEECERPPRWRRDGTAPAAAPAPAACLLFLLLAAVAATALHPLSADEAAGAPAAGLVPVSIIYRHPAAARVELLFGVDGWREPTFHTGPIAWRHGEAGPIAVVMAREPGGPGVFRADLSAPPGATLDFVFHVTEPFDWWDNNGGEGIDYHATVGATGATVWVTAGAGGSSPAPRPMADGGTRPDLASGGAAADAPDGPVMVMGHPAPRLGQDLGPTRVAAAWMRRGALVAGLLAIAALLMRGAVPLRWPHRLLLLVGVAALAAAWRAPLVASPRPEIDELDYVPVAMHFAVAWRLGDLGMIVDERRVVEHPRLALLLHAAAIRRAGAEDDFVRATFAARRGAVLLAVIAAVALAWRWPVAAILFALVGLGAKYTAVAYLDAATVCFAVVCVLAFDAAMRAARWDDGTPVHADADAEAGGAPAPAPAPSASRGPGVRAVALLTLSALAAGATVSSKYLGAVAPLAVAAGFVHAFVVAGPRALRRRLALLFVGYVVVAVAAMIATDPSLWARDLPARFVERLLFHRSFSTSDLVADTHLPWYQPVAWLWTFSAAEPSVGWAWLDRAVTLLGLGALPLLARRAPRLAWAMAVTLLFLFLWPTKWPQYEVVLLPWLAVGAEVMLREAADLARRATRRLAGDRGGVSAPGATSGPPGLPG